MRFRTDSPPGLRAMKVDGRASWAWFALRAEVDGRLIHVCRCTLSGTLRTPVTFVRESSPTTF